MSYQDLDAEIRHRELTAEWIKQHGIDPDKTPAKGVKIVLGLFIVAEQYDYRPGTTQIYTVDGENIAMTRPKVKLIRHCPSSEVRRYIRESK